MVDGLAAAADTPTSQTSQQLPLGNLEVDHAVERLPRVLQEAGQRLGLRDRAREPVDDEALRGVGRGEALAHQVDDHVVGHQRPAVHIPLGLETEARASRQRFAEDVPRGDVRHSPRVRELARLGALAGAGGSEKDETHASRARTPRSSATWTA